MKILITGCAGFIGSHLIKKLQKTDNDLLGLDIKPIEEDLKHFRYVKCDILDTHTLNSVFLKFQPNVVIHLAARTDLLGKNLQAYRVNTDGILNLINAIKKTPSVKRCVFTSSQLVCHVGYIPRNNSDFKPSTLYGESKVLTEKIVREHNGGDVEWCITRPTTIWGAGMSEHYQQLFRMISTGKYFHVGRSPLFKSYGYVGNTAHQYLKLLEAPTNLFHEEVFYLADYQPLSLRNWIDDLQQELGAKPIKTVPITLAKLLARTGDLINLLGYQSFPFNTFRLNNILTEYQFDLRNIERVTGPLPYSTKTGIKETVAWLKNEGIVSA